MIFEVWSVTQAAGFLDQATTQLLTTAAVVQSEGHQFLQEITDVIRTVAGDQWAGISINGGCQEA